MRATLATPRRVAGQHRPKGTRSFEVGRHLIEGLKNPTVVRDKNALDVFSARPMGVKEAIEKAIANTTE